MFSQLICNSIAGSYLSFYMTGRMLLSATMMGSVLLLTRIGDMVISVIAGPIVEKMNFKIGKYRAWLLYGPLAVSVGTTMCFCNPNIPMMGKAVMVFVGYLLYGGGMSFIQLGQNTMMAKVSGADMECRIKISGKMIQGQSSAQVLTSLITLPLISWMDAKGMDGYTVLQVVFAVIGLVGQLALFAGLKEYDKCDPNLGHMQAGAALAKQENSIAKYIDTLKNPQLIYLMICDMLRWGIFSAQMALIMYYFSYVTNSPNMMTVCMTVQSVLTVVFAFIAPNIVAKIGKKRTAMCTGVICGVSYGLVAVAGIKGAVYYVVLNAVGVAGTSLINVCGANLYLDAAEYQTYKTGKNNKTFAMSLFGVSVKIGFALSSFVVSGILNASGYSEFTATIASPETFVMLLGGVPAIVYLIVFLLMTFGYKITEEKAKEYAKANFAGMSQGAGW